MHNVNIIEHDADKLLKAGFSKTVEEAIWLFSIVIIPTKIASWAFGLIIGCSLQPQRTRWHGRHG
jgi:short subunit fatty acids transporter